jgi:adenylate cyclase
MKRRLAAILAADIAGYTKLVDADEERTLARVSAVRTEIIEPLVASHHGRIVKVMGDGFLIEFASAVEAVNCAAEWQERMDTSQQAEALADRLQFRIGINLGDVLADENDIHGDGVIIATRLEALADIGGILISEAVFQSVRAKTSLAFEPLGERSVKNISEPVRVHRVLRGAMPGSESRTLSLPEKPSIAVLPFANISDDPDQAYFADGLTEDIITGLSRVRQLFVIAHGSTRSYKEKPADVQQVGRELGVGYVLHGSVRRSGNRVRITTQLIDAQSRNQIWAEKYDRPLTDFFDLQDEITRNVVSTITTEVSLSEARLSRPRPMRDLGVWDLVKRAWGCLYESTPASIAQAEELDQGSNQARSHLCCGLLVAIRRVALWRANGGRGRPQGSRGASARFRGTSDRARWRG